MLITPFRGHSNFLHHIYFFSRTVVYKRGVSVM
jgi:hypothetical protein